MPATDLARARELAVVGVELLVQHEETPDLRGRELWVLGEILVDLAHVLGEQIDHFLARSEILIARIADVVALGPVADRL